MDDSVLQDWRDIIKLQQHWIGECDGVNFDFKIKNKPTEFVSLWSSNPEHIENVKFVAVTADNILARQEGITGSSGTQKLQETLINPFNNQEVPIFVTNEIEFLPFTDTFVGIPGINEEAANFANNHNVNFETLQQYSQEQAAKITQEICDKARDLNVGGYWTSAKLRDWLISRQRYWGTPIPIIHCENCGAQPVPREALPVVLPKLSKLSQKGASQLAEIDNWVNCECPKCKGKARRETDTMDTFVDSSWYYLRYLDPDNKTKAFDEEKAKKMLPVDLYIGGKEHGIIDCSESLLNTKIFCSCTTYVLCQVYESFPAFLGLGA